MTWTYKGDPSGNDRDWVRWKVQDTNKADQLVSNEEIDAELAVSSKEGAAAQVATVVARKFARKADISEGDVSIRYSSRAKEYRALVDELRESVAGATASGQTVHNFVW